MGRELSTGLRIKRDGSRTKWSGATVGKGNTRVLIRAAICLLPITRQHGQVPEFVDFLNKCFDYDPRAYMDDISMVYQK